MNELYYDHYKETCELQRNNEQKRNKYFIYFTITILILLLTSKYENNLYSYLKEILQFKYGINITIEANIIELFIWLITVYINLMYYQINATIEKNYKYIHNLEQNLSFNMKKKILRESENYLKIYPLFQNISYYFYKYIYPIIVIFICTFKMFYNTLFRFNLIMFILELIFYIMILLINISYIKFNYKINMKEGEKKCQR